MILPIFFDSIGQLPLFVLLLLNLNFFICSTEIPLPNEQSRLEILKIHARPINKAGDIDYEAVVKLSDTFNGADLRNVCTEAGLCMRLNLPSVFLSRV